MPKVFLSYQRRVFDLAQRVGDILRRAGMSVWWDQDLTPREPWDRLIERELAAADFVLVLWTRDSTESDWVRIEANYARNCQPSKLVQARFDHCEIPLAFSLIQFVDLGWKQPDASPGWPRLMQWLGQPAERPEARLRPLSRPLPERGAANGPQLEGLAEAQIVPSDAPMTKSEMAARLNEAKAFLPGKRVKLDFGDDGVVMLDGHSQSVTEDEGPADTTIKVAWADWEAMSEGKLDGMTAFMQGKMKVEGDMSNAMQLQGVLAKLRS